MKIPFINLKKNFINNKKIFFKAISKVGKSGDFILGKELFLFEKKVSKILKVKYCLGVGNGTDALFLALKSLDIKQGDEVLVPVNSFIASAGAVIACGAQPVFVDICSCLNMNFYDMEKRITKKTKAIMLVHYSGRPVFFNEFKKIAIRYNLKIIEDAAQAFGSKYKDSFVGSIGDVGCFSLHPLKNLNVYGDGGLVVTNNKEIYHKILKLRNHGMKEARNNPYIFGYNSRLDTLQAALANKKLDKLKSNFKKITSIATRYNNSFRKYFLVPEKDNLIFHTYHRYIVQLSNRKTFIKYLSKHGIETKIHYPILLNQTNIFKKKKITNNFPVANYIVKRILSLPLYPELTLKEVDFIVKTIKNYYSKQIF
jgi:dTDP-4-amino-4,6-dideoxygalactose transaminase